MSHQTKEWKRREKATRRRVKQLHRSGETQAHHYLTLAIRKAKCERCPRRLLRGDEFVYRHEPRQVLCVGCAASLGIKWRTSWRWEQVGGKRRQRGTDRATRRLATSYSPKELLAFLVIEAGRTQRGGFSRSMTERWGVPWPPPKGWRDDLVRRWSAQSDPVDEDDDLAELDRDLDRTLAGDVVTDRERLSDELREDPQLRARLRIPTPRRWSLYRDDRLGEALPGPPFPDLEEHPLPARKCRCERPLANLSDDEPATCVRCGRELPDVVQLELRR